MNLRDSWLDPFEGRSACCKAATETGQHTERRENTSMPRMGFEATMAVFWWADAFRTYTAQQLWWASSLNYGIIFSAGQIHYCFNETWMLNSIFIIAGTMTVLGACSVMSTYLQSVSLRFILIVSSNLHPVLWSASFHLVYKTECLSLVYACYTCSIPHLVTLLREQIEWSGLPVTV
jgi:hypothetical protein